MNRVMTFATRQRHERHVNQEGVRVVMLTAEHRTTAEAVVGRLGIDQIQDEVLPERKSEVVKQHQAEGHIVAMVGDSINDAPALAQAHVGIAMGTGTWTICSGRRGKYF